MIKKMKDIHKLVPFFKIDSLHARLNSNYEAWSHEKKKHSKIPAYRKSV